MLTGNAAVKSQKNQGDSAARDRLFQRLHGIERRFEDKIDSLAQKIHPHELRQIGDTTQRMAIVHCDTNGLGKFIEDALNAAGKDAADHLKNLSAGLNTLAKESYAAAWHKIFDGHAKAPVPAKILILGGDDISYAIHPAYALYFTLEYLAAFESLSNKLLQQAGNNASSTLTARAGILVAKTGFPIYRGLEMAETLANRGKSKFAGGPVTHSTVAFYRLRDTIDEKNFAKVEAFICEQGEVAQVAAQTMPGLVQSFLEAEISIAGLKSWLDETDTAEMELGWKRFKQMHLSEPRRGKIKASQAKNFFEDFEKEELKYSSEGGKVKLAAELAEWASVMPTQGEP